MLNVEMQEADIFDESVFALSLTENVAIFNSKGQRTALIPCIDTWLAHLVPIPQYLSWCGVLHRLFCYGFATTFC